MNTLYKKSQIIPFSWPTYLTRWSTPILIGLTMPFISWVILYVFRIAPQTIMAEQYLYMGLFVIPYLFISLISVLRYKKRRLMRRPVIQRMTLIYYLISTTLTFQFQLLYWPHPPADVTELLISIAFIFLVSSLGCFISAWLIPFLVKGVIHKTSITHKVLVNSTIILLISGFNIGLLYSFTYPNLSNPVPITPKINIIKEVIFTLPSSWGQIFSMSYVYPAPEEKPNLFFVGSNGYGTFSYSGQLLDSGLFSNVIQSKCLPIYIQDELYFLSFQDTFSCVGLLTHKGYLKWTISASNKGHKPHDIIPFDYDNDHTPEFLIPIDHRNSKETYVVDYLGNHIKTIQEDLRGAKALLEDNKKTTGLVYVDRETQELIVRDTSLHIIDRIPINIRGLFHTSIDPLLLPTNKDAASVWTVALKYRHHIDILSLETKKVLYRLNIHSTADTTIRYLSLSQPNTPFLAILRPEADNSTLSIVNAKEGLVFEELLPKGSSLLNTGITQLFSNALLLSTVAKEGKMIIKYSLSQFN